MNNSVYDVDFTRALPDPLKNDPKILALGRVIAAELQENIRLTRHAIIYARIDELDDEILDILARDFHVDWYDDGYPIEAKREVIKNSVRVHKRLGTKYAMVLALGSIFPDSEVQEWFEYGGTHHRFRIILNLTNAKAPVDIFQILRAAQFYKRLTAHLDEVIYQTAITIEIGVETIKYRYRTGLTGTYNAGTRPYRNVRGGSANRRIDISAAAERNKYNVPRAGTKPYRSTIAALRDYTIEAETDPKAFTHKFGVTGKYTTGVKPRRNVSGGVAAVELEIRPENKKHIFRAVPAGTKPGRSTVYYKLDKSIRADTETKKFLYTAGMTGKDNAGTQPHTNISGQAKVGGINPVIMTESYAFKVKRCGTSRTKK